MPSSAAQHPETRKTARSWAPSPHAVALVAAVLTWPLLLVGGTVSVYRFGMAVPDWPTTFQSNMFLYKFWNASWAVFDEHIHRLYASGVGFACIVLAGWFLIFEKRAWLKRMGVLALVAVIAQGVLGGLRVTHNSTTLGVRPRLLGSGVLRTHGRPLRLDRQGLELQADPTRRFRSSPAPLGLDARVDPRANLRRSLYPALRNNRSRLGSRHSRHCRLGARGRSRTASSSIAPRCPPSGRRRE